MRRATFLLFCLVVLCVWPAEAQEDDQAREGAGEPTCYAFTVEGQQEPSARTCSQLHAPVTAVELVGARRVACDGEVEQRCLRGPTGGFYELDDGAVWARMAMVGPCTEGDP